MQNFFQWSIGLFFLNPVHDPPTDLTDEVLDKIKEAILDGKTLRDIAVIINKSEDVVYQWHSKNYLKLADKIEGWRRDRKLMLAEKNIEEFLQMDTSNTGATKSGEIYDYTDAGLVRVKADISKFVSETLGKEVYSKRSEVSGPNGTPLIPSKESREKADKAINEFLNNENSGDTTTGN